MRNSSLVLKTVLTGSVVWPLVWAWAILSAPLPPIGPLDLEGRIETVRWVPEQRFKGTPGLSGSLGRDRTEPAHFLVTLTDYRGVDPQTAWAMTRYLKGGASADHAPGERPPFVLLKINHQDPNYLRAGIKIRIKGYTLRGDEGGTWSAYRSLEIILP